MKFHFLIFCALLTSVNIAKADTMETMRMYDKSLSKVLVEAARDGSFTDLDKIGRSIDIPELAHEINQTANHTIKKRQAVQQHIPCKPRSISTIRYPQYFVCRMVV